MKTLQILVMVLLLPLLGQAQDIFEIRWRAGITQYRAALVLFDDGTGKMRVRYYSEGANMIEQYMRIENTLYGVRLTGYNPVYAGTNRSHPSYSADNFYMAQDEYGNYEITLIDDQGVTASPYIKEISGYYQKQQFLSDFSWKLN